MVIARKLDGLVIVAARAVWPRHCHHCMGIEVAGTYLLFPRHGSLLGTFTCLFCGPVDKMGLCVCIVVTAQELGAQVVVVRGLSVRVVVAVHGDQLRRGGRTGAVWLHPRRHAGCRGPCGGREGCGYVLVASRVGTLGRVLVAQGHCAHVVVEQGLGPTLLLGTGLVATSLPCGGSMEPVRDCDKVGCVPASLSLSLSLHRARG